MNIFFLNSKWLHVGKNHLECTLNGFSRIRRGWREKHEKGSWRKKTPLKYFPLSPDEIFGQSPAISFMICLILIAAFFAVGTELGTPGI